ncbi:hypothetical protein ACTHQ4_17950 [Alkalicoccobacillus gibsonii]|uniref:hypothetical protein n=1 Tax=Alkalicoccobacillus gibsonii TaxID=79881 RepID=UPI003F7C984F
MKKITMVFILFLLVGCSSNNIQDDQSEEAGAEPLPNEAPTVSIYNSTNEELELESTVVCWNNCNESSEPLGNEDGRVQNTEFVNEEELEETLEIALSDDPQHTVTHHLMTYTGSNLTEGELEGNTFDVQGLNENQYAVITHFLDDDENVIGEIETIFAVLIK